MIATEAGNVYLAGFMGSGKTSVGRLLAAQLGYAFLDLDVLIETQAGRSIESMFEERGEAAFRKLESEVLQQTTEPKPHVMALGGGALTVEANRRLLETRGITVWLEVSAEEAWRRCSNETGRPLARDRRRFFELFEQRLPDYRKCEVTVDAEGGEAREVCTEVMAALLERMDSG